MITKLAVAIIGASGKMGSAIAKSISKGNYRVLLQSFESDKVQSIIDQIKWNNPSTDVAAVADITEACWEAEIIIAAVPYSAKKIVAQKIRNFANQKILVSISNRLNSNYDGLLTAQEFSAAEELQKLLPYAKVIKAFNTTSADDFNKPVINNLEVDCFIAGNNDEALQVVYDLVKTAGFNPVLAGDLSVSRTLESMQLLLIHSAIQNNYQLAGGKVNNTQI